MLAFFAFLPAAASDWENYGRNNERNGMTDQISPYAPDGDLIVGDIFTIARINQEDGTTVWTMPRFGSVSGNCGAAATDTAVYIDETVAGGHGILKLDKEVGRMWP